MLIHAHATTMLNCQLPFRAIVGLCHRLDEPWLQLRRAQKACRSTDKQPLTDSECYSDYHRPCSPTSDHST